MNKELLLKIKALNIKLEEEHLAFLNDNQLDQLFEKIKSNQQYETLVEIICEDLILNSVSKIERSGMKLGLHRMEAILKLFNQPQKKLKVIHIAGTNGKGSVSSYLNNVLSKKYKVGMYSSPSMLTFNDRIRINNQFITFKEMYTLYKTVKNTWFEHFPNADDNLSVFEILTTIALIYYEKNQVDFVIMEVGLGGRYDATNVFDKKILSIITKIGLDHTNILGDTLEKIAYEKAGIIQENDKVIIYPNDKHIINVINDVAFKNKADLEILNEQDIKINEIKYNYSIFSYKNYQNIKLKMLGSHQIYNASLALLAIDKLVNNKMITIDKKEIIQAIEETTWLGRLEWLNNNILIDGAHNIDGVNALVTYLSHIKNKKLKILIGILADKDYKEMITLFETLDAEFFVTRVPLDVKEAKLENLKLSFTKQVTIFDNYKTATDKLLKDLRSDEILVVSGSLYLISEIRKYIKKEKLID